METHIKAEPLKTMKGTDLQKIIPFLWFDTQAEEAARFYVSAFDNARIKTTTQYSAEGAAASGMPEGSVMTVAFQIEGLEFTAINGGPVFKITPSISFMVSCSTHQKIDDLWGILSEGGTVLMDLDKYPFNEKYGWIQDKYGVSWQLMSGHDTQVIAPCLMFAGDQRGKAEEAINFYMSLFENSSIERIERYDKDEDGPTGSVKYAAFTLGVQNFKAMDSGVDVPFRFSPALSLVVNCENQQEIDHFWDNLTQGGDKSAQQCGWLKDKYDVSWQIVPKELGEMLSDPDPEKSKKVMSALLQMKKLDINDLRKAYEGK